MSACGALNLAAGCLVFAQACASVLIAPGFALTVFSDVTQCILLLSGTAVCFAIAFGFNETHLFGEAVECVTKSSAEARVLSEIEHHETADFRLSIAG